MNNSNENIVVDFIRDYIESAINTADAWDVDGEFFIFDKRGRMGMRKPMDKIIDGLKNRVLSLLIDSECLTYHQRMLDNHYPEKADTWLTQSYDDLNWAAQKGYLAKTWEYYDKEELELDGINMIRYAIFTAFFDDMYHEVAAEKIADMLEEM